MKFRYSHVVVFFLLSCGSSTVTINGIEKKVIPGMEAGSIHTNFSNNGFYVHKDLYGEPIKYICTKYNVGNEMKVIITGKNPSTITELSAFYASDNENFNKTEAATFLGYVATSPYENNMPTEAREWVSNSIDKDFANTVINGVEFTLEKSGNKQTLTLKPAAK